MKNVEDCNLFVAGVAGVASSFYNIYFYMHIYITHHISRKL